MILLYSLRTQDPKIIAHTVQHTIRVVDLDTPYLLIMRKGAKSVHMHSNHPRSVHLSFRGTIVCSRYLTTSSHMNECFERDLNILFRQKRLPSETRLSGRPYPLKAWFF